MANRRTLVFDNLTQVMADVDELLPGYWRSGNWSLGQVCQHLSSSLRLTVEGFPTRAPWLVRRTIGPLFFQRLLAKGRMPEGLKLNPKWGLTPRPDLDDRAEAEALRGALRYYMACTDDFPEHPVFGRLSRPQWDRLQCIHCAHHLSFLWPGAKPE